MEKAVGKKTSLAEPRTECPVCSMPIERAISESPNHCLCPSCGLIYRKTTTGVLPEEVWDEHYYADDRVRDHYLRRQSGFRKLVAVVNRLAPDRGKWLDVGCGPGALLEVAYRDGWEVYGIDPSPICVESIRSTKKYACVVEGTAEEKLSEFRDFTVISFTDMLRIVECPGAIMASAWESLREGGWILVRECREETRRDVRRHESPGALRGPCPPLQEWKPRSLENALRSVGFKAVGSLPSPAFTETTSSEWRRTTRARRGIEKLLKRAAWPVSRMVHLLSIGRIFLGPNFVTLGRK